jgi:hypothetical protein
MCICNHDPHQANRFAFDDNITSNCKERNFYKNNGQCFEDHSTCPLTFVCIWDDCPYRSWCQFSIKGFDLSLDIILDYQIRPNIIFTQQRPVIRVTIAIVTLMIVFVLLNSILSMIFFYGKKTREVGCSYYLLASSCVPVVVIIIFASKFFILIAIQM